MADADYVAADFDVHPDRVHIFAGVAARHDWRADGCQATALSGEGAVAVELCGLHVSVHVVHEKPDIQWIPEFDATAISQRLGEC